ncbi:MAG: hypothetical protein JO366_18475, partial [Methylobacteriaceae bacterium]|nr:hypothetical protein [Methylobacteriaceae bacterium]
MVRRIPDSRKSGFRDDNVDRLLEKLTPHGNRQKMECGFVASNEEDGAVFRLFDMSGNNGRLVSFAESARCAAVLLGSLHYRADRIAAISDLGRSPIAPGQAADGADSDAALALAAYAHSGPRGLAGLEGDFCVV